MKKISTFVERLAIALKKRGLNCERLSETIEMNKGQLSRYATGKVDPKANTVERIAKALDVSPIWLIGYDVPMYEDNAYDAKKDIIRKLDELSLEQLEKLSQMIDLMFKS